MFQVKLDRRNGVTAGPEMFAIEVSVLAAQSSNRDRALPFEKPITDATGCLGGIAMHMCTWSGSRCPSTIWHSFCWANAWGIGPNWRRVIWNGLGTLPAGSKRGFDRNRIRRPRFTFWERCGLSEVGRKDRCRSGRIAPGSWVRAFYKPSKVARLRQVFCLSPARRWV